MNISRKTWGSLGLMLIMAAQPGRLAADKLDFYENDSAKTVFNGNSSGPEVYGMPKEEEAHHANPTRTARAAPAHRTEEPEWNDHDSDDDDDAEEDDAGDDDE